MSCPAGGTGCPFEASDLGRLPLLSAVIKEALRVCAPAPFGGTRYVVQEEGVELCGFHVPKVRVLQCLAGAEPVIAAVVTQCREVSAEGLQ